MSQATKPVTSEPDQAPHAAPAPETPRKLTRADFATDQVVRWCPGCGDYSILAQVQKVMPELGVPKENVVFVSGIGCSSRFPYYMNTYGFHGIHGRAPAIATGIKASRPELSVWVVTGDGDGLSIGGNHLLHCMRRNLDVNILLFNNRIYGLTKGQYSPTSEMGKKTKSSPMGTIENPVNPICVAIAAEATFVARSFDADTRHLSDMIARAARHKGVSFIEIYQNCNIFNDGAFREFTEREWREDRMLYLEHGKPMLFGKDRKQGIRLRGCRLEVVSVDAVPQSEILVHDERADTPAFAYLLTQMNHPEFPVPVGVFRAVERPTYEDLLEGQIREARARSGEGDLEALLNEGDTWTVE